MGEMGFKCNSYNVSNAIKRFKKHHIPFKMVECGRRFTVVDPLVDYWPYTGKWIVIGDGHKGRGLNTLMQYLGIITVKG